MSCLRISSKIILRKTCFEYTSIKHLSVNSNRLLNITGISSSIQKRHESTNKFEGLSTTSSDISEASGGLIESTANKLSLLADAPFTHMAENVLIYLNGLELGWPASIFVTALLFRLFICIPVKVYQEHTIAKLLNVQPKIIEAFNAKTKSINKNAVFLTPELKKKLNKQVRRLLISKYFNFKCFITFDY
jgi:hypothetical protein